MEQALHIDFTHFNSEIQIMEHFGTEDKCRAVIAQERWGEGAAICPYCGSTHTHVCKDGRYICKGCQRKFSVTVGTIFENRFKGLLSTNNSLKTNSLHQS